MGAKTIITEAELLAESVNVTRYASTPEMVGVNVWVEPVPDERLSDPLPVLVVSFCEFQVNGLDVLPAVSVMFEFPHEVIVVPVTLTLD